MKYLPKLACRLWVNCLYVYGFLGLWSSDLIALTNLNQPHGQSQSQPGPDLETLSQSRTWLLLLHYRISSFGGLKSLADGPAFFLAKDGRKNPLAELKANVEAMREQRLVGVNQAPAGCVFPLRFAFIKQAIAPDLQQPDCPKLEAWLNNIKGDSLSLVFSSYYPAAPASMFGHTFLKLNNAGNKGMLLDYIIDFAASTEDDRHVIQALKGLFGYYKGRYSLWPYYIKVKQYNHGEHRDLIEYQINFSAAEVRRLLSHLWELGNTWFDYYFIDENCSYHPLNLLMVAKPEWDLFADLPAFIIPIDTVRAVLNQPGALVQRSYRPSLAKRFGSIWLSLPEQDQRQFYAQLSEELDSQAIQSAPLNDALNLYMMRQKFQGRGKLEEKEARLARRFLIRRSQLQSEALRPSIQPAQPEWPEGAHLSSRVGLGGAMLDQQGSLDLNIRPALHDMASLDTGFKSHTELEFLDIHVRYLANSEAWQLRELNILKILSLNQANPMQTGVSYAFDLSLRHGLLAPCASCVGSDISLFFGKAYSFDKDRSSVFALIGPMHQADLFQGSHQHFGLRLLSGMSVVLSKDWKSLVKWQPQNQWGDRQGVMQKSELSLTYRYSQRWEAALEGRREVASVKKAGVVERSQFGMRTHYYF